MALIKAGSMTLGLLKFLYPKAALDLIADSCGTNEEKAHELMDSFRGVALRLAAMLGTEPEYDTGL